MDELYAAILDHHHFLLEHGKERLMERDKIRARNQVLDLLKENLMEETLKRLGGVQALNGVVEEIIAKRKDPYGATSGLVERILGGAVN